MEVPLCETCGHHHTQGIRCDICGHVGKSQIFPKMRSKAKEKRSCKIKYFAGAELRESPLYHDLILNLRQTSMIEDFGFDRHDEIITDLNIDFQSDHVLIFAGDLPVATARIGMQSIPCSNSGSLVAPQDYKVIGIDEFYVLPSHRYRGFAYKCFCCILRRLQESNHFTEIAAIQIRVVEGSWQIQKLVNIGFTADSLYTTQSMTSNSTGTKNVKWISMTLNLSQDANIHMLLESLERRLSNC